MTVYEARDELERLRVLDSRINSLIDTIEVRQTQLERITPTISDMRVQGGVRGYDDAIVALMDLKRQCNNDIDKFADEKERILKKIERMSDPVLKELLRERYVDCKEWEFIAINLNYGRTQIWRLHNKALESYSEL